ncbi:MAG: hypothetical protein R6U32_01800 [Candidatus Woesearchaeota archaeon]
MMARRTTGRASRKPVHKTCSQTQNGKEAFSLSSRKRTYTAKGEASMRMSGFRPRKLGRRNHNARKQDTVRNSICLFSVRMRAG